MFQKNTICDEEARAYFNKAVVHVLVQSSLCIFLLFGGWQVLFVPIALVGFSESMVPFFLTIFIGALLFLFDMKALSWSSKAAIEYPTGAGILYGVSVIFLLGKVIPLILILCFSAFVHMVAMLFGYGG